MLDKLVERFPITMAEDGSDYDGPLSTYPEWHSLALGLGLGVAFATCLTLGETPAMFVAATITRTVIYAHTEQRVEIAGRSIDMPSKYLRQIRKEPHYLYSGVSLGVVETYALRNIVITAQIGL